MDRIEGLIKTLKCSNNNFQSEIIYIYLEEKETQILSDDHTEFNYN